MTPSALGSVFDTRPPLPPQFQQGAELSKIDSAIDANAAENHASVARRSYVSPYPKAYKDAKTQQLHEWDGGYIQVEKPALKTPQSSQPSTLDAESSTVNLLPLAFRAKI